MSRARSRRAARSSATSATTAEPERKAFAGARNAVPDGRRQRSARRGEADFLITREQMMPLLLASCPSFAEPWQRYVEAPGYEEDLLYLHLNEFAAHMVSLLKEG